MLPLPPDPDWTRLSLSRCRPALLARCLFSASLAKRFRGSTHIKPLWTDFHALQCQVGRRKTLRPEQSLVVSCPPHIARPQPFFHMGTCDCAVPKETPWPHCPANKMEPASQPRPPLRPPFPLPHARFYLRPVCPAGQNRHGNKYCLSTQSFREPLPAAVSNDMSLRDNKKGGDTRTTVLWAVTNSLPSLFSETRPPRKCDVCFRFLAGSALCGPAWMPI